MGNKINMYICYTVMHLYVSILKALNSVENKNILLITDHILDYERIANKIYTCSIFDQIIVIRDKEFAKDFNKNILNYIFFKSKLIRMYEKRNKLSCIKENPSDHIKIYIFLDQTRCSQYFMLKFPEIILVEDGLSIYVNRSYTVKDIIRTKIFKIPDTYGRDSRIKMIEVTNPSKLPAKIRSKATKLDIKFMYDSLDNEKQDIIRDIFITSDFKFSNNRKILILTQPYSEDMIICEEKKVSIYARTVSQYLNNFDVYIKPHPRELTDYKSIFTQKNVFVLDRNFPIEIFDIMPIGNFEKGISINSTALQNLKCTAEKEFLGVEILNK